MTPAPWSRRRLMVMGAVVAVHVVLILACWRTTPAPRREPDRATTPLTIRFVTLPALPAASPMPPTRPEMPEARHAPTPPRRAAAPRRASAPPMTALPTVDPPATTAAAAAPVASAASSAAGRLDLALPTRHQPSASAPSWVDRALNDPRSNSARLSPEQRMNRRFEETDHVDTLADGSVRVRRGDRCSISKPTRAMQLDPSDPVHNRTAGAGACP